MVSNWNVYSAATISNLRQHKDKLQNIWSKSNTKPDLIFMDELPLYVTNWFRLELDETTRF